MVAGLAAEQPITGSRDGSASGAEGDADAGAEQGGPRVPAGSWVHQRYASDR